LSRVRDAVATLRPLLAGERGPGGFKLDPPPAHPVPIVIAALRERMARLAGAVADGVFLNLVPLSGVGQVVAAVREGEAAAGRPAGACEVACRFFCIPGSEEDALGVARFFFAAYGSVPVYAAFFRALGWGEQLDPMVAAWDAKDRAEALRLAPEALMREIFLVGSPEQMRAQLERFEAEGIQTASLFPLCGPEEAPAFVEALAPG
jgi:alkanesulfonate monooxygenase SsuD/methylene tetrahydromethanopterin reductase-like flavin-dependent oxidoreductase (luciferase family)